MYLVIFLSFTAVIHGDVLVNQVKGISPRRVELHHDGNSPLSENQAITQEKVRFQFYYETGCPYSITFYIGDFKNTVRELAPYLDITTYPYGNGNMLLEDTKLEISCQHGEEECYGNMLHACAIDALKDFNKYIPFNACMMSYDISEISNDEAADKCGKDLNVDSKPIKECAKGMRGFELLLYYGIESRKVSYGGVPWWYVNGVSKRRGTRKPLKDTLCTAFKNPPEVCKK